MSFRKVGLLDPDAELVLALYEFEHYQEDSALLTQHAWDQFPLPKG